VHAKKKNPAKILDFFTTYSHEILSESDTILNLRAWYVLPYIVDPEKDPEFGVYFTQRWADVLRISLQNILSAVLKTSPTPKLLLLDRWHTSEAQEILRAQVKNSIAKIDDLSKENNEYQLRIKNLQTAVRNLVLYMYKKSKDDSSKSDWNSNDGESDDGISRISGVLLLKKSLFC
jgi:hypothetical protein